MSHGLFMVKAIKKSNANAIDDNFQLNLKFLFIKHVKYNNIRKQQQKKLYKKYN